MESPTTQTNYHNHQHQTQHQTTGRQDIEKIQSNTNTLSTYHHDPSSGPMSSSADQLHPHMIDSQNGAPLSKQLSVQLTAEQFERLYLQPGGAGASRQEDFTKRFGNPTVLGLASFLLCLTPVSCYLMGFLGTDAGAFGAISGVFFLSGGLGLYLAAIMEWIIGNTFPFVVFGAFGGFWLSLGYLTQPAQGIGASLGATTVDYNNGVALWLIFWGVLTFVFLVTATRTNVVFVLLFLSLDFTFFLLSAGYTKVASGHASMAGKLFKAGGAFAFVCCMCGWYILLALMLASNGFPSIPVGDLSGFLAKRKTT